MHRQMLSLSRRHLARPVAVKHCAAASTYEYQSRLPHLPVPDLEHTLQVRAAAGFVACIALQQTKHNKTRHKLTPTFSSTVVPCVRVVVQTYLNTVRPVVDDAAFAHTSKAVTAFADGPGPELHQRLVEYAATQDNWLERWWDQGYLDTRLPSVLNVNYAFGLKNEAGGVGGDAQTSRTARLVAGVLDFKSALDRCVKGCQACPGVALAWWACCWVADGCVCAACQ